jgi:hypothetical protein
MNSGHLAGLAGERIRERLNMRLKPAGVMLLTQDRCNRNQSALLINIDSGASKDPSGLDRSNTGTAEYEP